MRKLECHPRSFLVVGVLGSVAMAAAFAIADRLAIGLVCGGIVLAYTLVVILGSRRSATLQVLSGRGDERTMSILTRATAQAGSFLVLVILVWWLVTVALGNANTTLNTLAAVFGATFIVAVAVLQRRS